MAVLAGAHMTFRVQRVAAKRTWRPSRCDDPQRALHERPRAGRLQSDPQHVAGELGALGPLRLLVIHLRLRFDENARRLLVPGQRQRADPELLLDRRAERGYVLQLVGRGRRYLRVRPETTSYLVQELVEPFGERGDLDLLESHRHHACPAGRLKVESALSRLAHGPRDEAVGIDEVVELPGHEPTLSVRRFGHVCHTAPAPPPTGASEDAVRLLLRRLAGTRSATEPPLSLRRRTNGRSVV